MNFLIGKEITRHLSHSKRRNAYAYLILGILANLFYLGYFKYANFLLDNIRVVSGYPFETLAILVPIGISFYTISQIQFLVDVYQEISVAPCLLDYALFVTFFPYLASGPIHRFLPIQRQFEDPTKKQPNFNHLSRGSLLFIIGLFKKVVIADHLQVVASNGFSSIDRLNFSSAWLVSVSETLRIYFDFSGYTDMAIGTALLFNITLNPNFNSPLRARNLIDFWNRWHMSLTHFLTNYLFVPITKILRRSGERKLPLSRALFAVMLTMILAGLWHGASWNFLTFGALHGLGLCVVHLCRQFKLKINGLVTHCLTLFYVNLCFVFFPAKSVTEAGIFLKTMFGLKGVLLPSAVGHFLPSQISRLVTLGSPFAEIFTTGLFYPILIVSLIVLLFPRNSNDAALIFKRPLFQRVAIYLALFYGIIFWGEPVTKTFEYFKY